MTLSYYHLTFYLSICKTEQVLAGFVFDKVAQWPWGLIPKLNEW